MNDPVFSDRQARHEDVRALALELVERDDIQEVKTEQPSPALAAFMWQVTRDVTRGISIPSHRLV